MKASLLFLLAIAYCNTSYPQMPGKYDQLLLERKDHGYSLSRTSARFNDIFNNEGAVSIRLPSTGLYIQKKVRTVAIENAYDKSPVFSITLDRSGRVSRSVEYWGYSTYKTDYETLQMEKEVTYNYSSDSSGNVRFQVCNFRRNGMLIRTDSIFYNYSKQALPSGSGKYDDTSDNAVQITPVISIRRNTYINGELLNERNAFYNKAYYNKLKPLSDDPPQIYLEEILKTSFPDKMVLVRITKDRTSQKPEYEFYKYQADKVSVYHHSRDMQVEYREGGEALDEPFHIIENQICGTGLQSISEYDNTHLYGAEKDVDGLYLNYYVEEITRMEKSIMCTFHYTYF